MMIELKRYDDPFFNIRQHTPYKLGGVKEITNETEYGKNHFAITIFDRRVFITGGFEYVKDADSGKYYVKNGKWVGEKQ